MTELFEPKQIGTTPTKSEVAPAEKPELYDPLGIMEDKAKKPTSDYDPLGIMGGGVENAGTTEIVEHKPTLIKAAETIGRNVVGTTEAMMSLSSGVLLWPFSKAYGLMALPWGAEVAHMAEEHIANLGYKPYTKEGRDAVELVSKAMEVFLKPTTMAAEEVGSWDIPLHTAPGQVHNLAEEAQWATQLAGELFQFAMVGKAGGRISESPAIRKARTQGMRVKEYIKNRRASIDKAILDSELFIKDNVKDLSRAEQDALPYIIQGIKDPNVLRKIGREDLIPIIEEALRPTQERITIKNITASDDPNITFQLKKNDKIVSNFQMTLAENGTKGYIGWADSAQQLTRAEMVNGLKQLRNEFPNVKSVVAVRSYEPVQGPDGNWTIKPARQVDLKLPRPSKIKEPVVSKLKERADAISEYYDQSHQFFRDHGIDLGYLENYVTQMWDIPKARRAEVVNYFATKSPFTKRRSIPTLEDGIRMGLKPKTTNMTELLRIYDQYKIKTVFNHRFALDLKGMVDAAGNKLMMRVDKAPLDWITIDHPALSRAMYMGEVKEGILLQKVPVKVHPEIAREVKIIFDKPFSHGAIKAWETVNAFTKKSMLSFSLFHHFALTEAAFSSGIGLEAIKLWDPRRVYKALKHQDYGIFENIELSKDAIDHNVRVGAPLDVQKNQVQKALKHIENRTKDVPALRHVSKKMRQANDLWDGALWDYYHNTLKLKAYNEHVQAELKTGAYNTPESITRMKNEVGEFVNDSFGGQNWDMNAIMGNPKMQQIMHWTFLAPDWTVSTLKQGAAPLRGRFGGKYALAKRGAKFWIRAGLYYNLIAQTANFYNTRRDFGEGKFTWENDPGHELNIYMGKNPDGTKRMVRLGKQFREVLEWFQDPVAKGGAKLSPALRESIRQLAAHDPGSGYPTEWADTEGFWKSTPARLKSLAEMPLPFSLRPYVQDRPTMFMFALPASKGMTNYKTIEHFKKALRKGSLRDIKHTFYSALENNLDAQALYKSAKSHLKSDITFDNKKFAIEIFKELDGLDAKARADAFNLYVSRGIITPEIYQEIVKLLKTKSNVEKQKRALGIR